jgi:hypothetical protein
MIGRNLLSPIHGKDDFVGIPIADQVTDQREAKRHGHPDRSADQIADANKQGSMKVFRWFMCGDVALPRPLLKTTTAAVTDVSGRRRAPDSPAA